MLAYQYCQQHGEQKHLASFCCLATCGWVCQHYHVQCVCLCVCVCVCMWIVSRQEACTVFQMVVHTLRSWCFKCPGTFRIITMWLCPLVRSWTPAARPMFWLGPGCALCACAACHASHFRLSCNCMATDRVSEFGVDSCVHRHHLRAGGAIGCQ